jgi:hypothetical protein
VSRGFNQEGREELNQEFAQTKSTPQNRVANFGKSRLKSSCPRFGLDASRWASRWASENERQGTRSKGCPTAIGTDSLFEILKPAF